MSPARRAPGTPSHPTVVETIILDWLSGSGRRVVFASDADRGVFVDGADERSSIHGITLARADAVQMATRYWLTVVKPVGSTAPAGEVRYALAGAGMSALEDARIIHGAALANFAEDAKVVSESERSDLAIRRAQEVRDRTQARLLSVLLDPKKNPLDSEQQLSSIATRALVAARKAAGELAALEAAADHD